MRARLRAGAVLLFVFAVGVLAGVYLERHHWAPRPAPLSVTDEHAAAIAELREFLELDEEQVEALHAILAERQQVVQKKWEQLRPEVQDAMRQVHVEIGEMLRPEQRDRFHDWLMRRREQHAPISMSPSER